MSYNPYMGYMFQQPQVLAPAIATPVTPVPTIHATPDRTEGPGLMQHQKEKYGAHLFAKNEDGSYTCFFANCGKQLSANFSRHISRHEQDGDPLAASVQVRGTKASVTATPNGLQSGMVQQPSMTPLTPMGQINPMVPMSPMTPITMTPLQPMASIPMVIPPAMPLPFLNNPMAAAMAHTQMMQQQNSMQQPVVAPQPAQTPTRHPKRHSSISNAPPTPQPTQEEMESQGIPFQVCQHPSHENWWGTSPVLPQSEFYNRASKCKKCYIKQQQQAKAAKIQGGGTSMHNIMSSVNHSTSSSDPMPITPKKREAPTPIKPPTPNQHISTPQKSIMPMQIQMPMPMQNIIPLQVQQQQVAMQQQQQMQAQQQYQQLAAQQQLQAQQQKLTQLQQQLQAHSQPAAIQNGFRSLPRPKRDPSPQEINRLILEKLKEIIGILMKDSRSKWFREPVDPIKMGIPDYNDVIKQPRDFGTIEKSLAAGKFTHFSMVHNDIKLVFKNAMTYNEEESDVYELAEELEKVYDDLFRKAQLESEAEAQLQAEIIKDICCLCRRQPVPYRRTPTQTTGEGATSPQPDETTPVPLLLCEGSCLRAFHLHCLGLPVDTKPPWMCEECHQGRPVLHFDPQKQEYFYYYYEGVSCDEEQDNNSFEGNDEAVVSNLGMLAKEEKVTLRQEEESHRVRDMYFDPVWCMWRCKSRAVMKQREDRQKPLILAVQSKVKRIKKKRGRKPKNAKV
ncbi:PHD zinc finger-containing protein [Heterostelium album PN500]|uniref:PHD zinc finger-containing protein n=1 Tax=Heterostelium pallidum (strain ATCC 26659 / Pp 5 / PN500) TaxID=670386 RepID=D3BB08_HETP5|nr:PHD zinc finger-containing protein [Heterostelium album PN500]EFA81745.1 PHD zinc finger-containing protein [Heterostelium album PN500]|eukprot:XP_020433862.1 PHD zinc finger-containing protein [Heterostelium album PN500]